MTAHTIVHGDLQMHGRRIHESAVGHTQIDCVCTPVIVIATLGADGCNPPVEVNPWNQFNSLIRTVN